MATTATLIGTGLARSGLIGSGLGLWEPAPHSHDPFSVVRKMIQGAGAGFLMLSGAGAIDDGQEIVPTEMYDFTSADGLTEAFFAGAFNDPIQIAGAAFIFLAAGKCVARFFGLAAALAAFAAYTNGVSTGDIMAIFGSAGERLSAAATAFMNPTLVEAGGAQPAAGP